MKRRAVLHTIAPGITCIDDAGDSVCYVVCGNEKAAVIDTVNGVEDLHAIVREITQLPLIVINTHGHCDHVWGNTFFDEAYIHPADVAVHDDHFAFSEGLTPCPLRDIHEGEIIDLGGKQLEVILIAGHTPGSIALLDRQTGFLFSGDAINGQIWMQLSESTTLETYLDSLNALDAFRPAIKELHAGHNVEGIPATYIDEMKDAVRDLLATKGEGDADHVWFNGTAKIHAMNDHCAIIYDPERL